MKIIERYKIGDLYLFKSEPVIIISKEKILGTFRYTLLLPDLKRIFVSENFVYLHKIQ